jgi:hypothetical protein
LEKHFGDHQQAFRAGTVAPMRRQHMSGKKRQNPQPARTGEVPGEMPGEVVGMVAASTLGMAVGPRSQSTHSILNGNP